VARGRTTGGLSIELEGIFETLKAVRDVEADLRPGVNNELRDAAEASARVLLVDLQAAAASSGVPVAPRVAGSARVKRDRVPVVSIGGATRVGRRGAPAGQLVWGSEQGPKGSTNHWGVPPSSGYWIAPAVERAGPKAVESFRRAVADIFRKHGLL
jgi:hypothetical protein